MTQPAPDTMAYRCMIRAEILQQAHQLRQAIKARTINGDVCLSPAEAASLAQDMDRWAKLIEFAQ